MGESFMKFFESFGSSLSESLPGVLGALLLLIVGFFVAGLVRRLVLALLKRTSIDEKIGKSINLDFRLDRFVAKLVYYIVLLFFLLLVLEKLNITSVLDPVKNMLSKFLDYIPNIIGAGIIGFVGYIVATIVKEAVGFFAEGIENLSNRIGLNTELDLVKLLKQIVFLVVFIPILILALDSLKMSAISEPAVNMLNQMMAAIPKIIGAGIIIGVFYIVGKYVTAILTELLRNVGLDNFSSKLGLSSMIGENVSLSKVIGNVAFFFLMFGGIISAMERLEMDSINAILNDSFHIAGKIFFGLIIMVIGNWLANVASTTLSKSADNAGMATLAKVAILGVFLAMALNTMGIGKEIVNLAFGLTLGAVAVAFALSFGLGGREAAGETMSSFLKKFRKDK